MFSAFRADYGRDVAWCARAGWLSSPVWARRDGRRGRAGRPPNNGRRRPRVHRTRAPSRPPRALCARRGCLAEHVAHGLGPGFLVEFDQALEFAQDMGVAEGVIDHVEPTIRQEVVMHDYAPLQILRDCAALFTGAIEGESQARRRVQPLQLAGDAKPRFVEMAHLHFGHALADARIDLPQVLSLLSNPGHDAGRADQRRAETIAQSSRGPILGNEFLDIEIDRPVLDALTSFSAPPHALGQPRP